MSDRSFDSHWLPRRSSLYTHRRIDPDESESDVSSFLDLFRRPLLSSFRYIHNAQRRQRRRRDYAGRPPRMETAVAGSRSEHDPGFRVLRSMCVELLRCKRIAPFLPKLRKFLRRADYSLIQSTIREMATLESALSDLIDLFQIYLIRTRFVLRYVAIAMKSVTETLHKMVTYLEQVHLRPEERWVRFLRSNAAEARNLSISCRIHVYAQFLRNMGDVMRGSPGYNAVVAREAYTIICHIRLAQGIPDIDPILGESMPFADLRAYKLHINRRHWAHGVFFPPLPQETPFSHQVRSKSFGPHQPWAPMDAAPNPFILFMRQFDNNISFAAIMNTDNDTVCLLIRTISHDRPLYSLRRIEDVYIRRSNSAVNLYQRSQGSHKPTPWAVLNFTTWEALILFYCSFLSLKLQNTPDARIRSTEAAFHGENRCYETKIDIQGSIHKLTVLEDCFTGNLRLHAHKIDSGSVGRPAWTAFLTRDFRITTHSSRLLILRGVQPHAFWEHGFTPNARQNDLTIRFLHKQDRRDFTSMFGYV